MPAHTPFISPVLTGTIPANVAAAAGKVFFEIKGSATKKVKLWKLYLSSDTSAVISLYRHSAFVLSSPTAITPVKMDTSNPASLTATAQYKNTSANDPSGTLVGTVGVFASLPTPLDMTQGWMEPPTLNGTSEVFALTVSAGAAVSVVAVITEE